MMVTVDTRLENLSRRWPNYYFQQPVYLLLAGRLQATLLCLARAWHLSDAP